MSLAKLPVLKAVEVSSPTGIYWLDLFWIENWAKWLGSYVVTRKTEADDYFSFPKWLCVFLIQDDSAKEERRDHRGRLRGKQRELGRKGRHQKRGHGREETSPGKLNVKCRLNQVMLAYERARGCFSGCACEKSQFCNREWTIQRKVIVLTTLLRNIMFPT